MEDQVLVREFLSGDRDAFDRIYEKYSTELFRTACLLCRSRADAEDAVQETFVAFYLKAAQIKKPGSLRWWLIRCLTAKARDAMRRAKREVPEEEAEALAEADGFRKGRGPDFAPGLLEREAFAEDLMSLPPKYREVLVLYYFNGLTVKEIAALTGKLEGTVKSRLYHAREQLRRRMEGGEGAWTAWTTR